MMKLKKGDYIKLKGLNDNQETAVIAAFESCGFQDQTLIGGSYLGGDSEGDIVTYNESALFGTERRELTYDEIVGASRDAFIGVNSKGEGVESKFSKIGTDGVINLNDTPLPLVVVDTVNHPPHYTQHPSGVECIQITEHMGFNLGNAIKYVWRADLKNDAVEDLKKAVFYINREIDKRGK